LANGVKTPVLSMHAPPLSEKGNVEKGVQVTLGFIKALVENFLR